MLKARPACQGETWFAMLLKEESHIYLCENQGVKSLNDVQLIATIIGGNEVSAKEQARTLLIEYGSLQNIGRATIKDMQRLGMKKAQTLHLVAAIELGLRREAPNTNEKTQISSSNDAYLALKPLLANLEVEEFWILILNKANAITNKKKLSTGGRSGTVVDIKVLFKILIENNACGFVVGHNHPSNNTKYSVADKTITDQIKKAATILDVAFLDHIIVTDHEYFSFADEGLI
jgi:DNA repair protein RadC